MPTILTPKPRFGRMFAPDPQDGNFRMRRLLDPLREQFFPAGMPRGSRYYNPGPVLDQGNTGTCVGHAWRGFLDGAPIMTTGGPSPFDIYRDAVGIDEWTDNDFEATLPNDELQLGTSVRAGAKVLVSEGHVGTYLWAESAEDVRAWHLAGFGVVVLGINWYTGMMKADSHGFIHVRGRVEGGHAIKSTGWSDTIVPGGALRIQNNWGREWAQYGRAYILYADLNRLIAEDGEACAAIETKLAPAA